MLVSLLLPLVVGSIFLVHLLSTQSPTGEGIAVGSTPQSGGTSTKREAPNIIRLHDSDNVIFDVRVPESPVCHSLNQEYPGSKEYQ